MATARELVGTAQAGLTRRDLAVGGVLAALVHVALGATFLLTPPGAEAAAPVDAEPEKEGCASVVSPACVGAGPQKKSTEEPVEEEETAVPDDRRCPDPMRRILRREAEPPPPVAVDLLQAQLVAAQGVETGKRIDSGSRPGVGGQQAPKPPSKLAEAMGQESKLGDLLNEGDGGEQRKKKLGDLLGRADGVKGGEGAVNMPGSAYVREVKQAVTRTFQTPANVPPWEASTLVAKVRVTRMTAGGQVLEWRLDKKSGNEDYDDAVRALMNGYKSGIRSLPKPPPHILEEINSRGFVIELRGGRG